MRRILSWLPTLIFAAALLWFSHSRPWNEVMRVGAFLGLTLILEVTLARDRPDLPLYRRHLLALLSACAFGALVEGMLRYSRGYFFDFGNEAAILSGAGLGLAVASLSRLQGRRRWMAHSWRRGAMKRPDASRDLILVADPHWSADLVGLDAATSAHPDADWLFLGDCFDVWVGLPGMETEAQARFLAWVRARRQAGRWVGLWMGNREYFLDRHAAEFDLMGEGLGGGLPEERLAFEHGDLINTADWRYRLWNLISRSGVLWTFFRLLPSGTAARLAASLEAKLHTTNRSYKLAFPREAFLAAAKEAGGRVFLTGHFHTDEREGKARALPWAFEGQFQVWRMGQVESLS